MANPAGDSDDGVLRLDFDRRLKLQFCGSVVTSDAGLIAYRELDDALGLSAIAGESLADARTGKNGRHALVGMFRQSLFGRLAGYEDVNDAERQAMRWIVGGKAATGAAASASQMGRFETRSRRTETFRRCLTCPANGSTVFMHAVPREATCSTWIPASAPRTANKKTASGTATTTAPAIIRCSYSISSAIWNAVCRVPAMFTVPMDGKKCLTRLWRVIADRSRASISGPTPGSPIRKSTNTWKPKASSMRSGYRKTTSCRNGLAICSSGQSAARPTTFDDRMRTSPIKPEAGRNHVGSSPRSNGIRANLLRNL
jgi:Transposase DDE domain group 1